MRRVRALYAIVGLFFFVVGVVVYLPASVATGWVASDSPARFSGVTGTLLDGQAAYVSLPNGGINDLAWHIHPASLLIGHLSAGLTMNTDLEGLSATVTHTLFGSIDIHNLEGNATLGWFAKLAGYTFVPASARIDVAVKTLDFRQDDNQVKILSLAGQVNVSDARYELLNPPVPLGAFQADLSEDSKQRIAATIVDSRGALALAGNVTVSPGQQYRLDLRLRARPSADGRLRQLLTQLGQANASGWYEIQQQGRL